MLDGRQTQLIVRALARAGAKWTPVYRQPTDPNGMPDGEPKRIGCILGRAFRRGNVSILQIDVPGVVLRTDIDRFEGVWLCGSGEAIRSRDTLDIEGTRRAVTDVQAAGQLYILTLDG